MSSVTCLDTNRLLDLVVQAKLPKNNIIEKRQKANDPPDILIDQSEIRYYVVLDRWRSASV